MGPNHVEHPCTLMRTHYSELGQCYADVGGARIFSANRSAVVQILTSCGYVYEHVSRSTGRPHLGSAFPLLAGAAFDGELTRVMGEAFDAVCNELHNNGQPSVVHANIARRIIAAAKRGERDPLRLRQAGLSALEVWNRKIK